MLPYPTVASTLGVLSGRKSCAVCARALLLLLESPATPRLLSYSFPAALTCICRARLSNVLHTRAQTMSSIEDKYLQGAPETTVRSLNGTRVADSILRLVPQHEPFKLALRLIKMWCKNRGLYSNKLGYFGGVQLAILTARICQLYPRAAAAAAFQAGQA